MTNAPETSEYDLARANAERTQNALETLIAENAPLGVIEAAGDRADRAAIIWVAAQIGRVMAERRALVS